METIQIEQVTLKMETPLMDKFRLAGAVAGMAGEEFFARYAVLCMQARLARTQRRLPAPRETGGTKPSTAA